MQPALFIDRDGTINRDKGYVHDVSDLELYSDIPGIIRSYREKGYLVIVITNQSGINRGYFKEEDYLAFNAAISKELEKQGAKIDAFYHCPHTPAENCGCRKPKTGLIDLALKDFDIDMTRSVFIGDRDDIDGEVARKLGLDYIILKR